MNKLRDCEVIDVAARTNQREVTRGLLSTCAATTHGLSRPLGPQKWGPWLKSGRGRARASRCDAPPLQCAVDEQRGTDIIRGGQAMKFIDNFFDRLAQGVVCTSAAAGVRVAG